MIRLAVEGIMPERALLRLKRSGICLYKIKKTQPNRILFCIKERDCEKVFAIYPPPCYNKNGRFPYTVAELGTTGAGKWIKTLRNRVGIALGILLFCALTLFGDSLVFGLEFSNSKVYAKEVKQILKENGISLFSRYESGKEDIICAQLLRLDGVEFCSVKKRGLWLVVDVRLSDFQKPERVKGNMLACRNGTLLQLTVLEGTALKKVGDSLQQGETLVGGYFLSETEEKKECLAVARARIACTYEALITAEAEEEAFAKAYIEAGLYDGGTITERTIEKRGDCFYVKLAYTIVQSMNL